MTTKLEPLLWLSDTRGQYLPRDFALSFFTDREKVSGVNAEQWAILEAGPYNESYWEVWDEVLQDAIVTDENGAKFTLHQDGDLWLIPEGMAWDDQNDFYAWPEDLAQSVED